MTLKLEEFKQNIDKTVQEEIDGYAEWVACVESVFNKSNLDQEPPNDFDRYITELMLLEPENYEFADSGSQDSKLIL